MLIYDTLGRKIQNKLAAALQPYELGCMLLFTNLLHPVDVLILDVVLGKKDSILSVYWLFRKSPNYLFCSLWIPVQEQI